MGRGVSAGDGERSRWVSLFYEKEKRESLLDVTENTQKRWLWLDLSHPRVVKCNYVFNAFSNSITQPRDSSHNTSIHMGVVCFKWCVCALSHVWLFATSWTVAFQAPLFMEFSRQEYWSGLPFSSPGDLPNPRIKPTSPVAPELQVDSSPLEPSGF